MSSKRLHYSDEKWLDLISECRSSGLSDKDWCMEHQIGISTFYYHVKRLRNKECSIPPAAVGAVIPCQKQEVVELNFNPVSELPMNCSSEEITATAIKIPMHGILICFLLKKESPSAIVMSLVETAKANNLNDYKYLYTLLLYMPDYKNEPAGIEQLLPWSIFVQDKCSGIIDDSLELPENRGNLPI